MLSERQCPGSHSGFGVLDNSGHFEISDIHSLASQATCLSSRQVEHPLCSFSLAHAE